MSPIGTVTHKTPKWVALYEFFVLFLLLYKISKSDDMKWTLNILVLKMSKVRKQMTSDEALKTIKAQNYWTF